MCQFYCGASNTTGKITIPNIKTFDFLYILVAADSCSSYILMKNSPSLIFQGFANSSSSDSGYYLRGFINVN